MWTDSNETQPVCSLDEPWSQKVAASPLPTAPLVISTVSPSPVAPVHELPAIADPASPPVPIWHHGWPVPSTISHNPDEARACIHLPEFDALTLEKAQLISGRYSLAEAEYRNLRGKERNADALEIPHFERVFRIAAALAGQPDVQSARDYDALLILTAWHCVRPGVDGYLGSFPKALLCPLSHAAPPSALDTLSKAKRFLFDRRASVYLRYLLCNKYGLRTCADIENADLRTLLKSTGFRLIYPSAVPEFAFAGITRGEDPPVRPWKLTLRQELTDDRAAELLINAAL